MLLAAAHGLLRSAAGCLRALGGGAARRRTPDRRLLEERILPALAARADVRRVLFVGCAPYTRHYEATFRHAEYWTIEPSPRRRRWGARRHIVDRLEHLGRHVAPASFDAIVCNGVLGWGLDRADAAEAAFAACRAALRPGGLLVLGWNDVRPRNRVVPAALRALAELEPVALAGVGGPQVRVDGPHRHVFEFYRRPFDAGHGSSVVAASGAGAQSASGRHALPAHSS